MAAAKTCFQSMFIREANGLQGCNALPANLMGYMQKRSSLGASRGSCASVPLSSACREYISGACPSAADCCCCGRSASTADCCCGGVAGAAAAGCEGADAAPGSGESCVTCSAAGCQAGAAPLPPLLPSVSSLMKRSGTPAGDAASSMRRAGTALRLSPDTAL